MRRGTRGPRKASLGKVPRILLAVQEALDIAPGTFENRSRTRSSGRPKNSGIKDPINEPVTTARNIMFWLLVELGCTRGGLASEFGYHVSTVRSAHLTIKKHLLRGNEQITSMVKKVLWEAQSI